MKIRLKIPLLKVFTVRLKMYCRLSLKQNIRLKFTGGKDQYFFFFKEFNKNPTFHKR